MGNSIPQLYLALEATLFNFITKVPHNFLNVLLTELLSVTSDFVPIFKNKLCLHKSIFKGYYVNQKHLKNCNWTPCKFSHRKLIMRDNMRN